jgi:hypothetical protein
MISFARPDFRLGNARWKLASACVREGVCLRRTRNFQENGWPETATIFGDSEILDHLAAV